MWPREAAIINIDDKGSGTHWVAYRRNKGVIIYFDSFGNLKPRLALQKRFIPHKVLYNRNRYQTLNQQNCGFL